MPGAKGIRMTEGHWTRPPLLQIRQPPVLAFRLEIGKPAANRVQKQYGQYPGRIGQGQVELEIVRPILTRRIGEEPVGMAEAIQGDGRRHGVKQRQVQHVVKERDASIRD